MNRHDGEYAALIHKLAHRYAATLEPLILTDEDMTPHENKIRQELRAAGIQPGSRRNFGHAAGGRRYTAPLMPSEFPPFQVGDEVAFCHLDDPFREQLSPQGL